MVAVGGRISCLRMVLYSCTDREHQVDSGLKTAYEVGREEKRRESGWIWLKYPYMKFSNNKKIPQTKTNPLFSPSWLERILAVDKNANMISKSAVSQVIRVMPETPRRFYPIRLANFTGLKTNAEYWIVALFLSSWQECEFLQLKPVFVSESLFHSYKLLLQEMPVYKGRE